MMKRFLFTVTSLLFSATFSWAVYSTVYPVDTGASGDTVKEGMEKVKDEIVLIYNHINDLYNLQAGSTQPSDRDYYDVWMNTTNDPPSLQYWSASGGGSWQTLVAASGYATGVTFDNSIKDYTRNMYVNRYDTDTLRVTATSTVPATVGISSLMLQNTSNTDVEFSGAADTYYILAERSGSTTNFTLVKEASGSYSEDAGQRTVGSCYWNGSDFTWVKSYEVRDDQVAQTPEGTFHIYRSMSQTLASAGSQYKVQLNVEEMDQNSWFDNSTNYQLTTGTPVWLEVHGKLTVPELGSGEILKARIVRSGTVVAEGQGGNPHPSLDRNVTAYVMAYVSMGTSDTLELDAVSTEASTVLYSSLSSPSTPSFTSFGTALWGRSLGKVY